MNLEFSEETKRLMQCKIVDQDIDPTNIKNGELPTDIHLVTFECEGSTVHDLVRAFKMTDIFDPYHDTLRPLKGKVVAIKSGFGKILPRMFGVPPATPMPERPESPFGWYEKNYYTNSYADSEGERRKK